MGHMHGAYTDLHDQRIMSHVDLVCRYVTVSSKEHLVQSHHGYFPRLNVYTLEALFALFIWWYYFYTNDINVMGFCLPTVFGLVCWSLTSLCHSNGHIETIYPQC